MLKIVVIMNTAMEEIYSKKCCGYHDLNLEIQVRNDGDAPVIVPSYCDLETDGKIKRIANLMPHGAHKLKPGEQMSFYCYMDEYKFREFKKLLMYDNAGNVFSAPIPEPT